MEERKTYAGPGLAIVDRHVLFVLAIEVGSFSRSGRMTPLLRDIMGQNSVWYWGVRKKKIGLFEKAARQSYLNICHWHAAYYFHPPKIVRAPDNGDQRGPELVQISKVSENSTAGFQNSIRRIAFSQLASAMTS